MSPVSVIRWERRRRDRVRRRAVCTFRPTTVTRSALASACWRAGLPSDVALQVARWCRQ